MPFASVNTTILVLSSLTCQMGVFAAERGQVSRQGSIFDFMKWGLREWLILTYIMGAIFIGVGLLAFLSWRQGSWYGYDVLYAAAGTFAAVALVASFIHWNLFAIRPLTSYIFVVLYLLGAVLGFYPYLRYALGRRQDSAPQGANRAP